MLFFYNKKASLRMFHYFSRTAMNSPIGYQALIEQYHLKVPPHYRQSFITSQGRGQIRIDNHQETHIYPKHYGLKDPGNPFSQIEFAIKYDGINLEILEAIFRKLESKEIEITIKKHPTSKYTRILWFLYEFLTKKVLNLRDAKKLQYVDLLNPKRYFTTGGIKSQRHYVNNNLIGTSAFCPIIRKTKALVEYIENRYDEKARELSEKYEGQIIDRATHYLYTKETLSSYAIEREQPSKERVIRFINLLHRAANIETLTKKQLIELQNIIVDPRFIDHNYRPSQNYVGENINQYLQKIHYISPKAENVEELMTGLLETLENAINFKIHPVLIAAVISFGFVFIHPFEDGNGRIHRFLIHYILSKTKFTPPGIIFPVSAAMFQNMREYDHVLESFSKPLMDLITNYDLSNDGTLTVKQPSHQYYKYIDFTPMVEYLFKCIDNTLDEHFEKEIQFLIKYDKTKKKIQEFVDMPDNLIDLFIKFTMQNHGKIGKEKRVKYFDKLSNSEIEKLQSIVKTHLITSKNTDI